MGDLSIKEQVYENFKSKYLDLFDRVKRLESADAPASILQDIDFEIDLIRRDDINVHYILQLLAEALNDDKADTTKARNRARNRVLLLLESEVQLRSKRELIERFIKEYWDGMEQGSDIIFEFRKFWSDQRRNHLEQMCAEEKLKIEGVEELIGQYHFTQRPFGKRHHSCHADATRYSRATRSHQQCHPKNDGYHQNI